MSDSEDDLFDLPKMNLRADEEEDSYEDVFKPQSKRKSVGSSRQPVDDIDDGYAAPTRSHVCDECEQVFTEAVFCGECSMTYCLDCDRRYHTQNEELGLKAHFRHPLHGDIPRSIARHMIQLQKEEQEEAEEQAEKNTRQSIYKDEAQEREDKLRAQQQKLAQQSKLLSPQGTPSILSYDYAGSRTISSPKSVTINEYGSHSTHMRSSPPPPLPASADPWSSSAAAVAAAYPLPQAYAAPPAPVAQDWYAGSTDLVATQQQLQQTKKVKLRRPASASAVGHIPKTMMVLKSTRPTSPDIYRPTTAGVRTLPTRMPVSSPSATLSGKTAFGKNMLLHSTSAAMIHQILPNKTKPLKSEKGGHHPPPAWGDHSNPENTLQLRDMNSTIMKLKSEITGMEFQKGQMKTAVLKKQKALKEIARIATNLAKQPNLHPSAANAMMQSQSTKKRASMSSPELTGLNEKVSTIRTSNEILRLEIEQLQTKIQVLHDSAHLKSTGKKELASFERERKELIKQVSIDSAGRELDQFKKEQMITDLQFAIDELKKTVEQKKKQVGEMKLSRMQTENAIHGMKQEYDILQQKLDRAAAREIGHY